MPEIVFYYFGGWNFGKHSFGLQKFNSFHAQVAQWAHFAGIFRRNKINGMKVFYAGINFQDEAFLALSLIPSPDGGGKGGDGIFGIVNIIASAKRAADGSDGLIAIFRKIFPAIAAMEFAKGFGEHSAYVF